MIGAILGDVCGSPWEGGTCRNDSFALFAMGGGFTDDTVCTIAVADALLHHRPVADALRDWCQRYPGLNYGGMFTQWVYSPSKGPYDSYGNGGAMRVSPCGWLAPSLLEAESWAEAVAGVTHNHPEGLRGARAIAGAVWLARHTPDAMLQQQLQHRYSYELGIPVLVRAAMEPAGSDAVDTVPIALDCGVHATSVEDAIHRAVYIGGDSDTTASMAGAIAEARLGLPPEIQNQVLAMLPTDMRAVVEAFIVQRGKVTHQPGGIPMAQAAEKQSLVARALGWARCNLSWGIGQ